MCTELRNRGVRDVPIACCNGLPGLPEAIETVWPQSVVQARVVHLIRAAMRYVSYTDRKARARALTPIYTAATVEAAGAGAARAQAQSTGLRAVGAWSGLGQNPHR